MKKLPIFDKIVLVLTGVFLVFCLGCAVFSTRTQGGWRVETELRIGERTEVSWQGEPSDGLLEGEMVDLNTAEQSDLERLPDIGATRAQAILDWRSRNGLFSSVDDLLDVPGIGKGTLEKLRPYLTVSAWN